MLTEGVHLFKSPIGPCDLDGPSVMIGENHIKARPLRVDHSHTIAVNRDRAAWRQISPSCRTWCAGVKYSAAMMAFLPREYFSTEDLRPAQMLPVPRHY